MRKEMISLLFILAVGVSIQGCAALSNNKVAATQPASAPAAKPAVLSGKVVETMDAGGYTYVQLQQGEGTVWAAFPTTPVKVGEELDLLPGAEMGPFTSKGLNRTFDQIIFSGGVKPKGASGATMPAGHPAMPAAAASHAAPSPDAAETVEPFYTGKVVETVNAGAYTYILMENKDGKKKWAAVPATPVKVGEEVEIRPGTEMGNFRSTSLNRVFENITFSAGVVTKK